ncbi:NAD(P)-binding protein [Exidia glandulosa HHB12029]|uniref:NAD(P)-binding protein n=1 Tax=Exidia glandulosa HHB12029 TaxID=1314781 RepID=A0A166AKU6_EXIGL|nr:NAD(P)-binding protein [Exidia glandulosa HHB12029]
MAPVAFVIGAGPKVGRGVSRMLKSKGYNVAVGARTPSKSVTWAAEDGVHPVSVDVTKTETITAAFAEVDKKYGPPSIVVYNPGAITIPKDRNDPLTIPVNKFADDVAFGTSGLFAAAQEAVAAFRKTPKDQPKVFIATGNILPFVPANRPFFISLAVAKKAAAYQIELFANSYQTEGFRFYFASQIARDGKGVRDSVLSGEAHGVAYWDLIQRKEQGDWDLRFYEDGSEGPHFPVDHLF